MTENILQPGAVDSASDLETTITTPVNRQEPDTPPQEEKTDEVQNKVEDLPDWAQNLIKELRHENASRRVAAREADTRLGEYLSAIQELVTQVKGSDVASVPASNEKGVPESAPPAANEFLETVKSQLDHLAFENAIMRVVSETGLQREVIESLKGRTYDELLSNAQKLVQTFTMPSNKEAPESKSQPKNKPPKAPLAPVDADTDALRAGRYFGSGISNSSPLFTKTPGNLFEE